MNTVLNPLFILIPFISITAGLFFLINPSLAIELQRRFYETINWRIEPISMQKEIRNTRIMGFLLVMFAVLVIPFLF